VLKYAAATSAASHKTAAAAKPADVGDEDWKRSVDYAKQLGTYSEYALFAASAQATDPAKVMALGDGLEKINPQSEYERAYERKQVSDEMLVLMAEQAMAQQQWAKTAAYGEQAAALATAQKKPDGVSDADWQKRTDGTVGAGWPGRRSTSESRTTRWGGLRRTSS
jgi:hypothetical protein